MRPILSQEIRAHAQETLGKELPEFVEMVLQARRERSEIELSLKTFPGDIELLYLCLWVAYDARVPVRFVPKSYRASKARK